MNNYKDKEGGHMEARAETRKIRMSATKVRLVVNLIRGKEVKVACGILNNLTQMAAPIVLKTLNAAVANAENNLNFKGENLYIKTCYVNEGKTLKRMRPGSRGNYDRHDHRYCHLTIIITDKQM